MTISGGIKFFKKNKGLFKDGATITASTNTAQSSLMIDMSKDTNWISIGSNDATTETITLTLSTAFTIDRILLVDINLKDFSVDYWNGSAFVNFANVVGLDGVVASGIIETTFSDTTAYYEFDSVSTTIIRIQALKTQVVNAEKSITSFIVTEELGTLAGYPIATDENFTNNERVFTNLNFKSKVYKSYQTYSFSLAFVTYPLQADIDLSNTLFNSVDPFIVWPCGGKRGTSSFRITKKGYNLIDVYTMQIIEGINPSYTSNIYVNGIDQNLFFVEAE